MNGVEALAVFIVATAITLGTFYLLGLLLRWAVSILNPGQMRITDSDRGLLERFLPYYGFLSAKDRRAFEQRVGDWVNDKEWHGRGVEVSREMQVLIAGSAVQVTFGLDPLLLMHFTRIIVYPDQYRNRTQDRDHIGEVNPGMRVIAISWKHFMEGFDDGTDARNVGLHEMAHALWFENDIPNGEDGFLLPRHLKTWRALAKEEAERINAGEKRFFRDYAATNQAEFFAVAVEYFFEQPLGYREQLPDLYEAMCQLLGQDPRPWPVDQPLREPPTSRNGSLTARAEWTTRPARPDRKHKAPLFAGLCSLSWPTRASRITHGPTHGLCGMDFSPCSAGSETQSPAFRGALFTQLTDQGSNLDSSEPKSDVLPVTPSAIRDTPDLRRVSPSKAARK